MDTGCMCRCLGRHMDICPLEMTGVNRSQHIGLFQWTKLCDNCFSCHNKNRLNGSYSRTLLINAVVVGRFEITKPSGMDSLETKTRNIFQAFFIDMKLIVFSLYLHSYTRFDPKQLYLF